MKVKKWDTVIKRMKKKYPFPKAMITYEGRREFGIIKITKKGSPPIMYQSKKKIIQGVYDPMKGKWEFFEKASGKRIKI